MEIITIGLDCKQAPVEVREKISFTPHMLAPAFGMLGANPSVQEVVILSTCNRVELYIVSDHVSHTEAYAVIRRFLSAFHEVEEEFFAPYLYYLAGRKAVQHLFEVASGIQSMVLGEPQIQGQVREAVELARKHQGAGRVMDALFRAAISAGKRARTETHISESGVSVSYTAIELLAEKAGSLEGKQALIIGGGKTANLTAQILLDKGVAKVAFVNRSLEKVCDLARSLGQDLSDVGSFGRLTELLARSDVVVTCTGAPHTVVTRADIEWVMQGRENRPLYMVDIAVPRDIDPEVKNVPGVYAYDIDDVKVVAEANLARRFNEVGHVRAIVREEVEEFMQWLGSLAVVPTITTLRRHADAIRQAELERIKNAFGDLNDKQLALLEELTSRIVNKLLHEPTLRLKEAASSSDGGRYAEVVQHLFSLQGVGNEAN
jgi:glutamyl-tRNA reductase